MIATILNAIVLDTNDMNLVGERHITIDQDRIVDVDTAMPSVESDQVIDARGRFLLPGFIDGHNHHVITTMDFGRLQRLTPVELALGMGKLAEATVRRGFTTVRDTGGDTRGLVRAIQSGMCDGPRIVRSGRVISQTGGHGDLNPVDGPLCVCEIHSNELSHVADGPDAVRLAVRRELRDGSEFIKIMTSGGVASPSDPFDSVQFTASEIRAATIETDHRHTYTTSHAYHPESIMLAIDNGVRCIEHGNLIDETTAARMVELDVTMVPTLVTYQAMAEIGEKSGLPQRNVAKNAGVFEAGCRSIEIAKRAGVELGLGTDLLGEAQPWQNRELAIRANLEPAADVLRSMYQVNAKLCLLEGQIGVIEPGAFADFVLTAVDPLADLAALADPEATIDAVIRGGQTVVDRISSL